jgi:hypothetical protein
VGIATLGLEPAEPGAALFIGRERELEIFRKWLVARTPFPEILNVSGRGGVGKTTLLHAFRRVALELDRPIAFADGSRVPRTLEGFLNILGGTSNEDVQDVVDRLNDAGTLILLTLVISTGYIAPG